MLKIVLNKLAAFIIFGLIWLFIFSIPLKNEGLLFDKLHFYIVNTKPVHWVISKISSTIKTSENTAKDTANEFIDKIETEVKK